MCTTELVKRIAEEDHVRVHYTKIFNPLIRYIKIKLVLKAFGDYVYKEDNV
jgi:UDP-glucose 4-epimerase